MSYEILRKDVEIIFTVIVVVGAAADKVKIFFRNLLPLRSFLSFFFSVTYLFNIVSDKYDDIVDGTSPFC